MPSFTYGVAFGTPESRSVLVSLSVNNHSGEPPANRLYSPRVGCTDATVPGSTSVSAGRGPPLPQDQVLRNQAVGRTCSVAASGPRLLTVISTRRSSGVPFPYSTSTSKYR